MIMRWPLVFILLFKIGVLDSQTTKQKNEVRVEMSKAKELYHQDNFPEAAQHYLLALKLAETLRDSFNIYMCSFQLGAIYERAGKHQQAFSYIEQALEIAYHLKDQTALSNCHMALGSIFISQKKLTEAENQLKKALAIAERAKDNVSVELCINNLGVLYNRMGKVNEAKTHYEKALKLSENRKDSIGIIIGMVNLGGTHLKLGNKAMALELYKKAESLSRYMAPLDVKQKLYEAFSDYYLEQNNYQLAYSYFKMQSTLKDSIFNKRSNAKIEELNSKYQFEKKQREIDQLRSEQQTNEILLYKSNEKLNSRTYLLYFFAILLLVIVFFGYLLFRQYRVKQKINEQLAIKNEQMEKNLAYTQQLQNALKHDLHHYMQMALRKQMNPHFIFNSLNSIQSFILQNDKLSANLYLSNFSNLMRKVLENSRQELISIKEELDTLKLYLELEQKRFEKKFTFTIDLADAIEPGHFLLPPLILQPYVENAIWHGLLHKEEEGHLDIRFSINESHIICSITDNGIGREAALQRKQAEKLTHESFGTRITSDRLSLINSLNQTEILVHYKDLKDKNGSPSGTTVEIQLPVISTFSKLQFSGS